LVFKPGVGFFKKSSLYAASMIGQIIALCSRYMMEVAMGTMDRKKTDSYIKKFWQLQFKTTHTRLYVMGLEYLDPRETYIFMSNHESWMDIPAIFGAVPHSLRMVSKAGLMKVPIFGHAMVQAGFIAVDRKNRQKAIRQLGMAKDRLAEGLSIWLAPEGTRSRTGEIAQFKKGGFYLAQSLEKPIVPVFIEGSAKVMPADSLIVKTNQSITVHFLKPIPKEEVLKLSLEELLNKTRDAILKKQIELGEQHVSS
jgi:1-acyl-sn-glycerol-3-phosphate acyltransferase